MACLDLRCASVRHAQASNDERALRHAACALGAFTALPEVQFDVSRLKAVASIVKLARSRDPETQRHAARAIGHLAGNAQCQKEIAAAGGLRPLIKCGYSRSAELQQLVVRAPDEEACTLHPAPCALQRRAAAARGARIDSTCLAWTCVDRCAPSPTSPSSPS